MRRKQTSRTAPPRGRTDPGPAPEFAAAPRTPVLGAALPSGGAAAGRSRTSLTAQIVALVMLVALAVAAVAGVVGSALVRSTAQDVTRNYLSGQADVIAGQLADAGPTNRIVLPKLVQVLRGENITVAAVDATGRITGPQEAVRAAIAAGAAGLPTAGSLSRTVTVGARKVLVEGRFAAIGAPRGFALVTPANDAAAGTSLQRRVLLALAIGLAAAVLGGLLLARVMVRPLRRTAAVARAMGAGSRDLRVAMAGPHEVADVALAVNELADALQHSESRQREFLTSVSHELRTPLTAIVGQSQALADGIVADAEVAAVGATIAAESARMQRLVADLLDLARLGADSFRVDLAPCDLVALLSQLRSVWTVRCQQRGVPLEFDLPAGPVVTTDARRLRQVLDGLAENALRLLGPGQPLVFGVYRPAPGPAGAVRLQVRDGGPGLRPEDYPVAFQRGVLHEKYRSSRPSGAGLGLALANSLITRLGGTITAGPAPEGGVAMTIDLPPEAPAPVTR